MGVNKNLLRELEEMGFSEARATKALHYSGNSSIDAAINWIIDHENDADIDEMPLEMSPHGDNSSQAPLDINIEAPNPSQMSDLVKLKAQQLREHARRKKEEEEKKLERNREKERIRAGIDLLEAKQIAEENERRRYVAQRKAEKAEERRARERIRQKLEQDKAERRRRGIPGFPMEVKRATSSLAERENLVPLESATLPAKSSTELDLLRECLISLKRHYMGNDAQVKRAFQTLLIYISNVANYPEEGKFRKIRLSNPAFQNRVGKFREGIKFLELCGFERDQGGEFFCLPRDKVDMALLKAACSLLRSAITNPFFGLLSRYEDRVNCD